MWENNIHVADIQLQEQMWFIFDGKKNIWGKLSLNFNGENKIEMLRMKLKS